MAAVVDFYFDIISPYACIGYQIMREYEQYMNVEVNYRPVSMAALFKVTQNKGPALIPRKYYYLKDKAPIICKYWNVERVTLPEWFEETSPTISSALPLRVISYIQQYYPEDFDKTTRTFFSRMFTEHKTNHEVSDVEQVLNEVGIPTEIMELAQCEGNRKILRDNVIEASQNNAFGVPYLVLKQIGKENEVFFGVESFPLLFHELGVPQVKHKANWAKL
ncbi:unnamed protein product [Bursaphelenchus okinawaensis]|uniref:DSBA-like thioredoxin domain-containing protein n=1 Tax=Bursaphelenchus okinawaensis TaxID=465554 RepID=A0A811LEC5_9BILA|nr:unnamed protein product [Bursaphelenchus okinawaensis]CAG9122278.1 unnamed protein product [Bursaphelenchus okinawaensis]